MSRINLSQTETAAHRALAEARLSDLLKQSGSAETVHEIKKLIFDSAQKDFHSYVRYLIWILEKSQGAVDIDAALPVIQDAWNYFPHRFLHGRSPAEVVSIRA
jgi:hypothetical protein